MGANLFLVGAAKSGTTSLAEYLDQHPEIFICRPKEPNFFAYPPGEPPTCNGPCDADRLYALLLAHSVTDPHDYERLFQAAGSSKVRGDASVRYLYAADAAERIHRYAPDARILAILRDPIDRLNSHYHMNVKMGVEPLSLPRALAQEDERVAANWGWDWHYVRVGRYAEQLQRFYERFDPAQIHVIIYDEFVNDPVHELRKVFQFLGVSSNFVPQTQARANVGRTPRSRLLRRLLWEANPAKSAARLLLPERWRRAGAEWLEGRNQQRVPGIAPRLRSQLARQFQSDRARLTALLGRNLPW